MVTETVDDPEGGVNVLGEVHFSGVGDPTGIFLHGPELVVQAQVEATCP